MQYEILYSPSYSLAKVKLEQGESIVAESGAMVSMSDGISIDTSFAGGSVAKRTASGTFQAF